MDNDFKLRMVQALREIADQVAAGILTVDILQIDRPQYTLYTSSGESRVVASGEQSITIKLRGPVSVEMHWPKEKREFAEQQVAQQ